MEGVLKIFDMTPVDLYMILVVGVGFIILWQILSAVLFNPFLELTAAREQATIGVEEEAQLNYVKAEVGSREYEAKVSEARKIAYQKKIALIDEAKKKSDDILNAAKEEAANITAQAKASLANEAEGSRKQVMSQVEALAADMVAKLKTAPTSLKSSIN